MIAGGGDDPSVNNSRATVVGDDVHAVEGDECFALQSFAIVGLQFF